LIVCPHPGCTPDGKSFSSNSTLIKHIRTQHTSCAPECQFCSQVQSSKRQSDPSKLLCQHFQCPRKGKPFKDTDGARKHERRTAHQCPPKVCKLCDKKLDVAGMLWHRMISAYMFIEQDKNRRDIQLVQEVVKQQKEQIRFQSLIRNNRKSTATVSRQEAHRRQKEAESLLLRTFACDSMEEALALLFKGRNKQPLICFLEHEKKDFSRPGREALARA